MPAESCSASHGCLKQVTMSVPVWSTSVTSVSDRRGLGRLSLTSWTNPSIVHFSPMRACAMVVLSDRST